VSRDRDDIIEGAEQEGGLSIGASSELEAALREAEESVDEVHKQAAAHADAGSPDKLTIELLSSELQSLKDEFEARGKELDEAAERQARLQAEFENFRRRTLKERQESLRYGHQNLVKDLLTSVDNLDRAIEHSEQNEDADFQSLLQGIDLVRRELLAALGKHGVSVVEAAQQPFDPRYHEAMGQVPDGSVPPNTVVAVLQKGYLLHDRMLRPARVMVSRAPTEEEAQAAKKST
jgi:molecular chaperone GrpE